MPMIKIRHKKETIKVPYVLVFIVLSCLVFNAYAFPYVVLITFIQVIIHSGYQLLVYLLPTNYRIPTN